MKLQPYYKSGDKIAGRYLVHQALSGGMGEVYLCLDLKTNQPYALKTFHQRYLTNPHLRATFNIEVATWVALEKHPNIVRCFWMDTIDNQPFMLLEWVASDESHGTDLRSWLRRGPLDLRLALDFTIDICRGLFHAGQKQPGIVHRDLKPDNILVAQGRLAKITDFGLVQMVQTAGLEVMGTDGGVDGRQSLQGRGRVVGTPPYMPPEQWRGEIVDVRADTYAVGCILYELLTGRPPFEVDFTPRTPQQWEQWLKAWQEQHERQPPPRLPSNLPEVLNEVIDSCLAKRREERFTSVVDLLQQLEFIYEQQFTVPPKAVSPSGEFTVGDYCNRGLTYANLQQYEEALADVNWAIQLDPNYAHAYLNRSAVYYELQRYEEALADLNWAIQLDPNYVKAYYDRGDIYTNLQRYEEALADFSHAIRLDPAWAPAYFNRGATYGNLQRYEAALIDFNRVIELNPNDQWAYAHRGDVYHKLKQDEAALADYSRAIELDPGYQWAYINRADIYCFKLEQDEAALADYSRVIELDPSYVRAYHGRGLTYEALEQDEAALADYSRVIELDPGDQWAYIKRADIYYKLGQDEAALADYSRTIELDPNYHGAYANRGDVYHKLIQYEAALADYDRAIELDSTSAYLYYNRGLIYGDLQRYDEALADLNQATQLDPNSPAYVLIGAVLAECGQWDDALLYLEKAAQHFEKAAQLGDPKAAQGATLVRQVLYEIEAASPANQIS